VTGPETPLRDLSDRIRQQRKVGAVLLGTRADGRVQLVLNLDKGLVERGLDAVQLIREIAQVVNGGGGGRPDFAEAGGREPEKLGEALDEGRALLVAALE
jgi:alanyl-tRNA synthetase